MTKYRLYVNNLDHIICSSNHEFSKKIEADIKKGVTSVTRVKNVEVCYVEHD